MIKISRLSRCEIGVFCTVLVLHFIASILLIRNIGREEPREISEESIVIHWIERRPQPTQSDEPAKKSLGPTRTARQTAIKGEPEVGNSAKNRVGAEKSRKLVLFAPEQEISFERDPLAKHDPLEATPTRMKVTILDRSFFGNLQRMTKAQICKDLRMALSKAVGDATTIMTTMQKEGCIRS